MPSLQRHYEQLAALLDYPTERTRATLDAFLADLRIDCPQAAALLTPLRDYLEDNSLESAQEAYTHTFDLNPVCTLGVGYHLFGEDYRRGAFLARLRESQAEVGIEAGDELPDHLPVILRWLARVSGTDLYCDMLTDCLLPTLEKMQQALAGGANPYRGLPPAVAIVMRQDLEAALRQRGQENPSSSSAASSEVTG